MLSWLDPLSDKYQNFVNLIETFKENNVSKKIYELIRLICQYMEYNPHFNTKARRYFIRQDNNNPFIDYEGEPDEITQIKKVLLGLNEAKIAFWELERLPKNWHLETGDVGQYLKHKLWLSDKDDYKKKGEHFKNLYYTIIPTAYKACQLLTHLDVNLTEVFAKEFQEILPYLAAFESFTRTHAEETKEFAEHIKNFPLSNKLGSITGQMLSQLSVSQHQSMDYELINNFTKKIPGYIDTLNLYIKKYSNDFISPNKTTSKEQVEEIQRISDELFDGLKHLKGNDLQLAYQALLNIYKIRHIITLSQTTLNEMRNVNHSSQNLLKQYLHELKYSVLPQFFGLIDKLEVHALLEPGTLSQPVMIKIKALYKTIIEYSGKLIDFSVNGQELLAIEDHKFFDARNQRTYNRISEANKNRIKAETQQEALEQLIARSNNPELRDVHLHELSADELTNIRTWYAFLQPIAMETCHDLHTQLAEVLEKPQTGNINAFFKSSPEFTEFLLQLSEKIQPKLQKIITTAHFQVALNNAILNKQKDAGMQLSAHFSEGDCFNIDEELVFRKNMPLDELKKLTDETGQCVYGDPKTLTYAKADTIALQTLTTCDAVLQQAHSHQKTHLSQLSSTTKNDLLKHYALLKPYFERFHPTLYRIILNSLTTEVSIPSKEATPLNEQPYLEEEGKIIRELQSIQDNYELIDVSFQKFIDRIKQSLQTHQCKHVQQLPLQTLASMRADYRNIQYITSHLNPQMHQYLIQCFNKETPLTLLASFKEMPLNYGIKSKDFELFITRFDTYCKTYENHWPAELHPNSSEKHDLVKEQRHRDAFSDCFEIANAYKKIQYLITQVHPEIHNIMINVMAAVDPDLQVKRTPVINQLSVLNDNSKTLDDALPLILEQQKKLAQNITHASHQLQFKIIDSHDRIIDQTSGLSAELALNLSQWYREKHNRLAEALKNYKNFRSVLKSQDILLTKNITPEVKAQLKNYYSGFQDYFINAVPAKNAFFSQQLDRTLADWFNDMPFAQREIPLFLIRDVHDYFISHSNKLTSRASNYEKLFKNKWNQEVQNAAPLESLPTEKRRYHLLKNQHASQLIHEIKTSIQHLTLFLDKPVKKQLLNQEHPDDIPFPEVIDDVLFHAQNHHTCGWKYTLNIISLLEQFFQEIEALSDESYQIDYIRHVGMAYYAIHRLVKNVKGLANDPYAAQIFNTITSRLLDLKRILNDQSDAYKTEPSEINQDLAIENPTLWYGFNAFYIAPKHIRKFSDHHFMIAQDLQYAQKKAKQSVANIERVLRESNSYVKIFINVPTVYQLFQELRNKLNEFRTTMHDAVLLNTDKIQSHLMTPILQEADLWEIKLGLVPGTISEPVSNILHEYIEGLLRSLELNSHQYLSARCDLQPIKQRICDARSQLTSIGNAQRSTRENFAAIGALYNALKQPDDQLNLADVEKLYAKVRPDLDHLSQTIALPDKLKLGETITDLKSLRYYVSQCHHYHLGLNNTYNLEAELIKNRETYLNDLQEKEKNRHLIHHRKFTEDCFEHQLKIVCNRQVGLIHYREDYDNAIHAFLESCRDAIINKAKKANDIEECVKRLLITHAQTFEQKHYAEYHQLDCIKKAIIEFEYYIQRQREYLKTDSSYSETEETVVAKEIAINELDKIANDKTLSIADRIKNIQDKIEERQFLNSILKYPEFPDYFRYVIHYVLQLLEMVYLYTPERRTLLTAIQTACEDKPNLPALASKNSFFSAKTALSQINPTAGTSPALQGS